MAANTVYILPMTVIAQQLTTAAGHPVAPNDILNVTFDTGSNIVRIDLKPTRTQFVKTKEFFLFTRQQAVNFYNNVSGSSIVASTILDIRFDPDDTSFIELLPLQSQVMSNALL